VWQDENHTSACRFRSVEECYIAYFPAGECYTSGAKSYDKDNTGLRIWTCCDADVRALEVCEKAHAEAKCG